MNDVRALAVWPLALLFAALAWADSVRAQVLASSQIEARRLVVMLEVENRGETFGAGIIVGRDDRALYIATANHVLFANPYEPERPPDRIVARFWAGAGKPLEAKPELLPKHDADIDLAVLKVALRPELARATEALPFHRARTVEVLQRQSEINYVGARLNDLHTVGNPLDVGWFTSDSDRFLKLQGDEVRFASSWLMVGHSGGGLFTEDWFLLGMIIREEPPTGVALGIDRIVERLKEWNIPVSLAIAPLPPKKIETFRDCPTCPEMVVVPAGEFTMGVKVDQRRREPNEEPAHRITIPHPFAVGKYEITVGEFKAYIADTGDDPGKGCKVYKGGVRKKARDYGVARSEIQTRGGYPDE